VKDKLDVIGFCLLVVVILLAAAVVILPPRETEAQRYNREIRQMEKKMIREQPDLYASHVAQNCCGNPDFCPQVKYVPIYRPGDRWQHYQQQTSYHPKCSGRKNAP
jgi:hypothetical protein